MVRGLRSGAFSRCKSWKPDLITRLNLCLQISNREHHLDALGILRRQDGEIVSVSVEVRLAEFMLLRGIKKQPAGVVSATGKGPLRAKIDETVLPVVINEQGENRNQCEIQRYVFGFSHGFACC